MCAQANSASYPQLTAGREMSLLAAPWVQLSVIAGNGWPHNVLRHHRPKFGWCQFSCHFRDCKALLVTSLIHVRDALYNKCPWSGCDVVRKTVLRLEMSEWSRLNVTFESTHNTSFSETSLSHGIIACSGSDTYFSHTWHTTRYYTT